MHFCPLGISLLAAGSCRIFFGRISNCLLMEDCPDAALGGQLQTVVGYFEGLADHTCAEVSRTCVPLPFLIVLAVCSGPVEQQKASFNCDAVAYNEYCVGTCDAANGWVGTPKVKCTANGWSDITNPCKKNSEYLHCCLDD